MTRSNRRRISNGRRGTARRWRPAARVLALAAAVILLAAGRPWDARGESREDSSGARAEAPGRAGAQESWKREYWNSRRKGANCQNRAVTPAYWSAARAAGIQFIRLIPDGWSTNRRDFLIGDADSFTTLDGVDLRRLREVLADARASRVKVVLSMFSLPGARWRQLNGDKDDFRLWKRPGYRERAFEFWRQLAAELAGDSAIVAYNPLNEPHPERAFGLYEAEGPRFETWLRGTSGTPADLNAFNRGMVAAIRSADPETPIILDGWGYSSAAGLIHLDPVEDPAVLYAFHNLGPWEYTTFRVNRGRFVYPDRMPAGWTRDRDARQVEAIAAWANDHRVPSSRIIAEEFWVDRRAGGARRYLEDMVALLDRTGWHWAFYAFREDGSWGGLDYELGTAALGGAYWEAVERGEDVERLKRRGPNPLWDVLVRGLAVP